MDPTNTAQDVTRCDLCETAIVQNYCDFCNINLCRPCIGEHIADEYDKHKIVSFDQRKSTLFYPKCERHLNEPCKYQCKDCNVFVCSHCTSSTQHKGHVFLNLEELFNSTKKRIKQDTEELENLISPVYVEIAIDIENQISSLDEVYEKLTTEMSHQRRDLHRDIDAIFNQMNKEISQSKLEHLGILRKHLDEIKQLQSLIKETKSDLNECEESNEVCRTIRYSSKIEELRKLPPKVKIFMPIFSPKQIKKEELRCFLGGSTPLLTSLEERVPITKEANSSERKLLDKPEVLKTMKGRDEKLWNVACRYEEEIWTSGETDEIICFNVKGIIQKIIKTKSGEWPGDISADIDGALLYSDWKTKSVNKVSNEQTEEIITTQGWIPLGICTTSSGDLLVTMCTYEKTQSKVVRYLGSTIKQTVQFDDEGKPLYSGSYEIKFITENRNLDICVADRTAFAVVVVNQTGKFRFRYTGHPSVNRNKRFTPRGITTDSQSRILAVDYLNNCIHIFDQGGQFLLY